MSFTENPCFHKESFVPVSVYLLHGKITPVPHKVKQDFIIEVVLIMDSSNKLCSLCFILLKNLKSFVFVQKKILKTKAPFMKEFIE